MYLCKCPSGCPQRAQPAFSVPHTSPLPTGPSLTKTESLGWDNTSEVRGLGKAVLCEVRPETHPDPKLPIVFPARRTSPVAFRLNASGFSVFLGFLNKIRFKISFSAPPVR